MWALRIGMTVVANPLLGWHIAFNICLAITLWCKPTRWLCMSFGFVFRGAGWGFDCDCGVDVGYDFRFCWSTEVNFFWLVGCVCSLLSCPCAGCCCPKNKYYCQGDPAKKYRPLLCEFVSILAPFDNLPLRFNEFPACGRNLVT